MKRTFLLVLAAGLMITAVCKGASVMTMTTGSDNVNVRLAGSGAFTIDWGDGSEIITGALEEYNKRWWYKRERSHNYTDDASYTVTITGENITHMGCFGNRLTDLDVSKNAALTYLECRFCKLQSLDVSKNTSLSRLICSGNELKSLDVSNNTALTGLDCHGNRLKSLDVSNNTSLTRLSCALNPLNDEAVALDNLFGTLNSNAGKKIILIGSYYFGREEHRFEEVSYKSAAKKSGWTIEKIKVKKTVPGRGKYFIPDIV
jgi:hypothetical protein